MSSGPARRGRYERLGSKALGTRLFLVSYAPLALMFALQDHGWYARSAWGLFAVWGLVDGWRLTYGQRRKAQHSVILSGIRDRGGDVSGYLATYLLPFISAPPGQLQAVLVYLAYFAVALVVYVRSDMVLINPTLYVLGWRVVEGVRQTGQPVLVLCRDEPRDGEAFEAVGLLNGLVRLGNADRS
jgi:hypothetical protein